MASLVPTRLYHFWMCRTIVVFIFHFVSFCFTPWPILVSSQGANPLLGQVSLVLRRRWPTAMRYHQWMLDIYCKCHRPMRSLLLVRRYRSMYDALLCLPFCLLRAKLLNPITLRMNVGSQGNYSTMGSLFRWVVQWPEAVVAVAHMEWGCAVR
jgi:hypothetical protein